MKARIEKLSELTSNTASLASRSLSSAQQAVSIAGVAAQKAIGDAIEHENTKAAVMKAKELATSATIEVKKLTDRVIVKVKKADELHKEVADKVEAVSMGLGITSGVVIAGAALAAPTGLGALSVAVGLTSAPLIVAIAPALATVSTVAGVVSGGVYLYSKWKSKKANKDTS